MPITREQWTAALRSGDYKQTSAGMMAAGHFGAEGGAPSFCCLGVACVIAGKPVAELIQQETSQFESVNMGRLYVELGLTSDMCDRLAGQNDRGVSFALIADVVEALPFVETDEEGAISLPFREGIYEAIEAAFDLIQPRADAP